MTADFDFWVGEWAVVDAADGTAGTNTIRRILDGRVLEESFEMAVANEPAFRGRSLSAYDAARGWCQTWVDNRGGYLDFVGEWAGDRMVLERSGVSDGEPVRQRMTWSDITPDALTWDWLRSRDGGTTWELLWRLGYRRTGSGEATSPG